MSALNYRPFPHLLLPSFLPLPNFLSKNQGAFTEIDLILSPFPLSLSLFSPAISTSTRSI